MKKAAVLTIRGEQNYQGQDPDVIELVTEGTLEKTESGWKLSYVESDLTGLEGVRTCFHLEPETITLTRTGKLNSEMLFRQGVPHESLYRSEFGALMIRVCATSVRYAVTDQGGTVDVTYSIEIEQSTMGMVRYHLDIRTKES